MFKVNKKLEYALMALKHMKEKESDELTSVKELCEEYRMPFDVMSKVMQKMVAGKLLSSEQGARGGYKVISDLSGVTILDLYETVMDADGKINCLNESGSGCALSCSCNIKSPMNNLNNRLRAFYKSINIDSLLTSK